MENDHEEATHLSDNEIQTQTQTQTQTQSDDALTPSQLTQEEVRPWGKLTPSSKCPNFALVKFYKDVYHAGKMLEHDIIFDIENIQKVALNVISKHHFSIHRELINNKNDYMVFLTDHSRNGTFVNRKLVGKNNKVVLENGDKIAIGKAGFTEDGADFAAVFDFDGVPYGTTTLPPEVSTRYTVVKRLGAGAAGEVHLAYSKTCFGTFAIKSISKGRASFVGSGEHNPLHDPMKIQREVDILRKLEHPCIIKMEDIIDTRSKVYIVLELMEGGELFDRISRDCGLPERVTRYMFWQICDAVAYLHSKGITHRDLKPENILLASDDEYPLVKISDFGMSKFLDAESMLMTYCGTPLYVAPEILKRRGRGAYTPQVDVWSLGVILYAMLSGLCPFSQNNREMTLEEQVVKGSYRFPPEKFNSVSPEAVDLIRSMLTVNPTRRRTIHQVLTHRWLTSDAAVANKIKSILNVRCNENRPINEINQQPERTGQFVFDVPGLVPKRARLG